MTFPNAGHASTLSLLGEVPMTGIARRNIARMKAGLPHGTVTFLFSDIEGSTELSRQYGASYGDLRAEHRRLLRESFEAHHGHEIDAEGDAFFIAFERASDAVAAAVAAQRALVAVDGVRVRMGLHTTDRIFIPMDMSELGSAERQGFAQLHTVDRSCCRRRPLASLRMTSDWMPDCATSAIIY